ncbi:3'5'-cyclic nucleotide phosphodiesterase [Xylariales sp. AK1849]|nr:3'5'-cyclic nucleotide phosphodiesterase [Xylariales sp. AK1849]
MLGFAIMDSATCNVIYVDRNVRDDTLLSASSTETDVTAALGETGQLRANLSLLIDAFRDVYVCATGSACITMLLHLHDTSMIELKPTIVLIDTPHDEQILESASPSRETSPHSRVPADGTPGERPDKEIYGLRLLERIVYETHSRNLARLVVPIPVITFPLLQSPAALDIAEGESEKTTYTEYLTQPDGSSSNLLTNRALLRGCLDSGAVDVMASPLHLKTLTTLEVHAYRAHKEALKEQQALLEVRRGRKRSWVGVHEEQPFSYLREAMVSGLMGGICKSGDNNNKEAGIGNVKISVSNERKAEIANAVGSWHFCAHDFDNDQLLLAASLIFKHAFSTPELEEWRIPTDQLTTFLVACRAAYNTFVPYHNFRHAVDVLQATFNFLVHIGSLPPYPLQPDPGATPTARSPLAILLRPFEALTLLISAIGHDVGHPGVNNGFLTTLNAPLAQLYNDRSVLESFHCAAYSQILRRHWPRVFENCKMRSLMISSILATDMGLHFDYMAKLGGLQERLHQTNSTEGWDDRTLNTETALACALLIKCADISNVARRYDAALKWMHILCDEFSRQASMETQIGIPSSLIAEPKKDFLSLAKAQLGFMNLFAIPLFQGIADILPSMNYTVDELDGNKACFEKAIQDLPAMDEEVISLLHDGALPPHAVTTTYTSAGSRDSSSGTTLEAPMQSISKHHAEMKKAGSSPPDQGPRHIPNTPMEYKEMNGTSDEFDHVADFAVSDPFNIYNGENRVIGHNGKQRCSETTDGSTSGPYSGDWASQATSATTGKMPLSPSTRGTSIISLESSERPSNVPTTTITGPESNDLAPPLPPMEPVNSNEEHSNGSTLKSDRSPSSEMSLKKKPSRFRMNALKLFRRDKGNISTPLGNESGG